MSSPSTSLSADFGILRYAQCWEDADVLLEGLNIQPGDRVISIASAGDNVLAMLTQDPAEVVAVDLSAVQLACLELRIAAYRRLTHMELLQLMGSRPCEDRAALYDLCRSELSDRTREYWEGRRRDLQQGLGSLGKFERYFRIFRTQILPWVQNRKRIDQLLSPLAPDVREAFYDQCWDHRGWRMLFRVFFSRKVMGYLGRDPSFFKHVEGSVGDRILDRTRHALRNLDASTNPYLHWILKGTHGPALPLALRAEHYDVIRKRLDRVSLVQAPIEQALTQPFDRGNFSDLFEYLSEEDTAVLLDKVSASLTPGGRLFYWNLLAPRAAQPDRHGLRRLDKLSDELLLQDKAWFYAKIQVEERI